LPPSSPHDVEVRAERVRRLSLIEHLYTLLPVDGAVARNYISGQEGVGIIRETSPGVTHLVGRRVVSVCIPPSGRLADTAVVIAPGIAPELAGARDSVQLRSVVPLSAPVCSPCSMKTVPLTIVAS